MDPGDNIAVALTDLNRGETFRTDDLQIAIAETVQAKHKVALKNFDQGDDIIMYGILVGKATKKILAGEKISVYNIKHASKSFAGRQSGSFSWNAPDVSSFADRHFLGFKRADGSVGTANHWIVIPLVFCQDRNLGLMREAMLEELGYSKSNGFKRLVRNLKRSHDTHGDYAVANGDGDSKPFFTNVDGIKFLSHSMGCGGTPADAEALCGLLAGYITHPNVGGATVLSLGCQDAQVSILEREIRKRVPSFDKPLFIFDQQQRGNEDKMLSSAIHETFDGLRIINKQQRSPAHLSKLTLGVECGGSDGFSGLSANPAIGHASDLITALKGTVLLSEFPELCGVEQDLINRCIDDTKAEKFSRLQNSYAQIAEASGGGFYLNPSAGNIKDGLITDAMKSAGAVKKGGTSPVMDVLDYPEKATQPGLNLLCTPGNDVESTTALVGSGANIVLFSTGLGTPTGNPIAPVIKVASNSTVANKMNDIIDIDAGTIISGEETIESVGKRILDFCIEVASGNVKPKSVINGQDDFIPWKRGVSL